MDEAVLAVLAIAGTIAASAGALIAVLIKERDKGIEREHAAQAEVIRVKDEELARERQRTADATADRKNMELRLQFGMETMKASGEVMQGAVDVAERAVSVMERLETHLSRPPGTHTRAGDRNG